MNWYIGQEVIWVGPRGDKRIGPLKITGIRESICKCPRVLLTTGNESNYTDPVSCSDCGVIFNGELGRWRVEKSYRPLISDSCIAELVKEQVLSTQ